MPDTEYPSVVSQMPEHVGSHISLVVGVSDARLRVTYRPIADGAASTLGIYLGDACLSITREQWNTLAAAVEAVLPVAEVLTRTATVQAIRAVADETPAVRDSQVLADLMESEGLS
jgi:hypothetical protein